MRKIYLICVIFILFLTTSALAQNGEKLVKNNALVSNNLNNKIDSYIKQMMAKYQIPGLSLAVIKDGKIVKNSGYGVANVEFDIPASENTSFQIYSVSKIFAGVAVMKLVEDGKLSLNTTLFEIFENSPESWKKIRVRNLLTHTSGLPEIYGNPAYQKLSEDDKGKVTADDEVKFLVDLPLKFEPGERFSYHQSGYRVVGKIVEKLSGKSYAEFLEDEVFSPLKMTSTEFGGTKGKVIKGRFPTAYNRESGELRGWIFPFTARDYPAAGLNTSASDLAKFFKALSENKVLKKESLETMWSPMKLNDGKVSNYGLGWAIREYKNLQVIWNEGGGAAWVAHFPSENLSVIVLCNLNAARADEIQDGVADFFLEN